MSDTTLHRMMETAAHRFPDRTAVDDPGKGTMTYQDLARLSDKLRDRLAGMGVKPGDRVGLYMAKSIDAIVSIFGILKTGAAYVPVDPGAPAPRCAYILNNCSVRVIITERRLADELTGELTALGSVPPLFIIDEPRDGVLPLSRLLQAEDEKNPAPVVASADPGPDGLAYILYTSGSTGKPKGVMLTHRCAVSYVDWCSAVFLPTPEDRFSSHAPLHFDLSILDIYVPLKHGATLILIGEELGKDPLNLAPLIAEKRITVWYSTPSILSLLAQYGKLARHDYSALRFVFFAGEVFPVPQLRALHALWPHPRYFNLYGPTETNVCTYYEVPAQIPPERTEPFPIGKTCEHLECKVVDLDGSTVPRGAEGELVVWGPGVMIGYWNLPEQNAAAFMVDPDGKKWYHTGDLVVEEPNGDYIFHGRRDRMVKRRGYRVELGEIEAGLATHPQAKEVAVVALPDRDAGVRIKAFLSIKNGKAPSIIEMKQFCMETLPKYMVPDVFTFLEALPRTSTDKIDYQKLKETN
ncbi:MAG: amino acid adenylation domain-containing protein [Gemmatimonadota bacterium]